ncbi:MAG: VOC family protein [Candidatus Rifleibacteriota bacterium]
MKVAGINHVTFAVSDIERSFKFYTEALGFNPVQKNSQSAYLLAGNLWVALVKDEMVRRGPLPEYTHVAFHVVPQDFLEVKNSLLMQGVVEWQKNSSEGDSFYFLDPDGHKLEIHSTGLSERIKAAKSEWGSAVEWFV